MYVDLIPSHQGEYLEAIECYTKCLRECEKAVIYTNRALCYLKLSKANGTVACGTNTPVSVRVLGSTTICGASDTNIILLSNYSPGMHKYNIAL